MSRSEAADIARARSAAKDRGGAPSFPAEGAVVTHIPAHKLPLPSTASAELRAAMARGRAVMPAAAPSTNADWQSFYNPDPAATRARIDKLLVRERLAMTVNRIGGVACHLVEPAEPAARTDARVVINLHGGGYVGGAGEAGLSEALMIAAVARLRVIAVDYRLAPDHPYPAALDDAAIVWTNVSNEAGAKNVVLSGTSAGGALALLLVQALVAQDSPVPAGIIAGSPWADLSKTGDSCFLHRYVDPVNYEDALDVRARQYAGGRDLADPALSPVYGSFSGFPPTLLISGTRDILLSSAVRVDRKIRDAGGEPTLIVHEGVSHGGYLAGLGVPECRTAISDMAAFIHRRLGAAPQREGSRS